MVPTAVLSIVEERDARNGIQVELAAAKIIGGAYTSDEMHSGWVKEFLAVLNVTAVPTGGTPTLDIYLQTKMPDGTWQDIAHFPQIAGSIVKHKLSWKLPSNGLGTQAEGAAVTVDNFFADADATLAATIVRLMPMGAKFRAKGVFAAGGSTGTYTVDINGFFKG